ncbi:hypothetical protein CN918_25400 [Priestia megaterium]|nr:hypothetical protein CN918_25400 [Priestia megaterium]
MENLLFACMRNRTAKEIRSRFLFLNVKTGEIKDVTRELVKAIKKFNTHNQKLRKETGQYHLIIPYEYKEALATYSFGCGNTHYLQENYFSEIVAISDDILTFPLETCRIVVYSPEDIKHILGCKNAFDENIEEALLERNFPNYQSS